jgi:hypothetical protein
MEIERSLKEFDYSKNEDLYESIGAIWGGNSIFYYDKDQAVQHLIRESEITPADRPPEFLK